MLNEQKLRKYIRNEINNILESFGIQDQIPNMSSDELIEKMENNIKFHILPYNLKDGNKIEIEMREVLHRFKTIEEWKQTTPELIKTLSSHIEKYMKPYNLGDMGETEKLIREILKRLEKFYNK